jgi:4-hydroxy 2-oxovalerate aldolase
MSGIYKAHPNNVIYLTEKHRLANRDIGRVLSMISPDKRQRYDYNNIEELYIEYISEKVDDYSAVAKLRKNFRESEILVIVPGESINVYRDIINQYIIQNDPIVITVSFVSKYDNSYSFFGNQRKYIQKKDDRAGRKVICSSNIKSDDDSDIIIDYNSLINREYRYFENSTIMLLNLLKRIGVPKITLAGFDGFRDQEKNYFDSSYVSEKQIADFDNLNNELSDMFRGIVNTMSPKCEFNMITPSLFEKIVREGNIK